MRVTWLTTIVLTATSSVARPLLSRRDLGEWAGDKWENVKELASPTPEKIVWGTGGILAGGWMQRQVLRQNLERWRAGEFLHLRFLDSVSDRSDH